MKYCTAILTLAALAGASCSGSEEETGATAADPIADSVPTAAEAAAAAEAEVTEENAAALLAEIEKELGEKP